MCVIWYIRSSELVRDLRPRRANKAQPSKISSRSFFLCVRPEIGNGAILYASAVCTLSHYYHQVVLLYIFLAILRSILQIVSKNFIAHRDEIDIACVNRMLICVHYKSLQANVVLIKNTKGF